MKTSFTNYNDQLIGPINHILHLMTKLISILVFTLFTFTFSYSQTKHFEISGKLISKKDNSVLESATVYLQNVRDSTLISYTISDQNGTFLLEDKTSDKEINFFVSYIGYKTFYKKIKLDKSSINLGNIPLKMDSNTLDEIILKSSAPITIKKDTIEFNVKSFKTKKDANIEDLLKELPGFEINENGEITINGKKMNKILINGKPFFGDDPTIATKNLSKDIIEKVQVLDTKTDAQAFTGEESDGNNKTINLVIKKENNKGAFGRLAAGLGSDERYEAAGMYNRFNNDLQLSVLAAGNNINSPGFSYGEINKMFGGNSSYNIDRQVFGYDNKGIVVSKNAGLNFANDWGKKITVATNYFFANTDSENKTSFERENILPDNRFFNNASSNSISNVDKHSTETKVKIKVDSTLLITITPSFRFINGTKTENNTGQSLDGSSTLINESTSSSFKENKENFFSNNINFTKRIGKKGSFLKLDFFNRNSKTNATDLFASQVDIYGNSPETISRNFNKIEEGNDNTAIAGLKYRLPLKGKELSLDFNYSYRENTQESLRDVFDFNETTKEYNTTINNALSSDFEYHNTTNTTGLILTHKKKKWSNSLETRMVFRTLENIDYLRPNYNLKRDFNAMEIDYRLRYRSQKNSFSAAYSLKNNPANLSQLQTFVDITNPLEIITGNPNLKQVNYHRLYAYFHSYNLQKKSGINFYVSSDFQNNKIVAKRNINENLIRETTYTNVNGSYNVFADLGYNKGIKIDSVKSIDLRVGFRNSIRKSINFYNDVKYASLSKSITPKISARFVWKDITEVNLDYGISFSENTYNSDIFDNQNFSYHNLSLRTTNHFNKKFEWNNQLNYKYSPNLADNFNKSSLFWNATLAYSFMKDKATLTLKAYDILNQNTDARRIINQNYTEDRQSTVLKRYFMLSFSWKFNTLGKKGEVRGSGRGYRVIR